MKKLALLSLVICAVVFSGCKREQHTYKASVTEYHFANHDNEVGVKTGLDNLNLFWNGNYTWTGDVAVTDVKAETRFSLESYVTVEVNYEKMFERFFVEDDDYFIYTLARVEDNGSETILHQYRFTKDGGTEIYVLSDKK